MLNPHRGTSPQSSPFLGGGCSLKPPFSSQAAARGENPRASPRGESGKDNPIGDRGKEGEGQEGLSSPFLQIQKFSFSRHLKEEALPFLPESIGSCGKAKVFLDLFYFFPGLSPFLTVEIALPPPPPSRDDFSFLGPPRKKGIKGLFPTAIERSGKLQGAALASLRCIYIAF